MERWETATRIGDARPRGTGFPRVYCDSSGARRGATDGREDGGREHSSDLRRKPKFPVPGPDRQSPRPPCSHQHIYPREMSPAPLFDRKASRSRENHAGLPRQNERRTCGGRSKANRLRGEHRDDRMLFRLSKRSERGLSDAIGPSRRDFIDSEPRLCVGHRISPSGDGPYG